MGYELFLLLASAQERNLLRHPARTFLFLFVGLLLSTPLFFASHSKAEPRAATAAAATKTRCGNVVFDRRGGYGAVNRETLSNPNFCGIDLLMDWADVEKSAGEFDFEPADRVAKAWTDAGKKIVIVLRFTDQYPKDCKKPQNLPGWVMEKAAFLCDEVFGAVIPNYFDDNFKSNYKKFVAAVADHFEKGPYRDSILYVRGAVGLGSEGFYLRSCPRDQKICDREPELAKLRSWGLSPETWRDWQKEMMSYYSERFHYTKVIYPLVALDVDPATGNPIQQDIAKWAIDKGMGLGALGLRPGFGRGKGRLMKILTEAKTQNPDALIQLQTFLPVRSLEELQNDISIAKETGAQTVEWYADDVNVPEYQQAFREWNEFVTSAPQ